MELKSGFSVQVNNQWIKVISALVALCLHIQSEGKRFVFELIRAVDSVNLASNRIQRRVRNDWRSQKTRVGAKK